MSGPADPATPPTEPLELAAPAGAATRRRRLSVTRVLLAGVIVAGLTGGSVAGVNYARRPITAPAETWFAPYVDTTLTPEFAFEDPATNPADDVVLGFVVADPDHGCTPSWGAAYDLDQAATALDLDRRVTRYRDRGGDVVVSFGGLANDELAVTCTDADRLAEAYRAVIERYDVTTIDLDIEGDAIDDAAANARRAEALATIQREARRAGRALTIWLTLPVTPSGLLANGVAAVDATLEAEVDLGGVNVMTMDYGSSREPSTSMAEAGERALERTHRQLAAAYRRAGIRQNDTQLWGKLGATPMIGVNDETADVFQRADARRLRSFALEHGLGRVSMWSANRDARCTSNVDASKVSNHCSGVTQSAGSFSRILDRLRGRPGARAADRTVADTTPVPADDPATSPYPIWAKGTVFDEGDKVVRLGQVYAAKWWTRGDDPDAPVKSDWDSPWRLVGPVLASDRPPVTTTLPAGTYPEWDDAAIYTDGDLVMLAGVGYRAQWWTQGDQPGGALGTDGQTPWEPLSR
ncbi:glycosyl hydrolase family 18 protein [soil metagenome]